MRRGTLYVKVGGRDVPVAPCTVDIVDGGVFVTEESARGKVRTHRRIGTLDAEAQAVLESARAKAAA